MTDDDATRMTEVLRLGLVEGLSIRAIARNVRMSPKTVRKILGRASAPKTSKPKEPRHSLLDPYLGEVKKLLQATPELSAPSVLERIRPLGYTGGVSILRDRIRSLRAKPAKEAFLTLDFKPGQSVQVDWADFGFALAGCPRRVSGFIAAMSYSRYLYLEFTLSQATGTFLRCMERMLRFYGGTTITDIFDNMKTVVKERTAGTIVFNARFAEYAKNRGFSIAACNPRAGHEKGRVERPVGFVRRRFWPGRRFKDLFDLNAQAVLWRDDIANNRIHDVTGKIPSLVFRHEEHRLLHPIQDRPFDTDDVESCGVTKSFRIRFDRNTYSVPWRLVAQQVVVRANDETVAIFLGQKQIALHARCWDVGQDIKHPSHEEGLLAQKPRAATTNLPPALASLGDVGRQYFKLLAANGRSIHREIVRLVFLAEIFGQTATALAMEAVMKTGHVGSEYVEYVLRHKSGRTPSPPPLRLGDPELDGIAFQEPDLSAYDELVPPPKMLDPGEPPEEPNP